MPSFRAYRIFEQDGQSAGRFVELTLDDLDPGEVVIQTHYSSVNYKDALAATGAGKVIRRFPCVGGVDAAGVVASSSDARFKVAKYLIIPGVHQPTAPFELCINKETWAKVSPADRSLMELVAQLVTFE